MVHLARVCCDQSKVRTDRSSACDLCCDRARTIAIAIYCTPSGTRLLPEELLSQSLFLRGLPILLTWRCRQTGRRVCRGRASLRTIAIRGAGGDIATQWLCGSLCLSQAHGLLLCHGTEWELFVCVELRNGQGLGYDAMRITRRGIAGMRLGRWWWDRRWHTPSGW
jgi:hypothetical protein